MALTAKEQAQIALIDEIYQNFRAQMDQLQRQQNAVINGMLQRVDHDKTQAILQQLKQS